MTKEYGCLTEEQRQLVNEHLDLVAQVLNKHIRRDEGVKFSVSMGKILL